MQKLAKLSDAEIDKLHGEFLYRYTKKKEVETRPLTAPPVLGKGEKLNYRSPSSGYHSMEEKSTKTTPRPNIDVGNIDKLIKGSPEKVNLEREKEINERKSTITDTDAILEEIKIKLNKIEGKRLKSYESESDTEEQEQDLKLAVENIDELDTKDNENGDADEAVQNKSVYSDKSNKTVPRESGSKSRKSSETSVSETIRKLEADKPKTKIRSKSAYVNRYDKLQNDDDNLTDQYRQPRAKSAMESGKPVQDLIPMPYMDHSKPKVVSVGSIGKISLLESISESKYWEDVLLEELAKRQAEQNGDLSGSDSDSAYSDIESNDDFEQLRTSSPKKRTKSKSSRGSESAILTMILEEEKARRRKVRSRSSEYSVLTKRRKSPATKSPRSNRSSSSMASVNESVKSPVNVKKAIVTDVTNDNLTEDKIKMEDNMFKNETDVTLNVNDIVVRKENNGIEKSTENEDSVTVNGKDEVLLVQEEETVVNKNAETKEDTNDINNLRRPSSQGKLNKSNLKQESNKDNEKPGTDGPVKKQKKVIILSTSSMGKNSVSKKPAKKYERLVNRMDGTLSETLAKRLLSIS